jgi:hypothetical protein
MNSRAEETRRDESRNAARHEPVAEEQYERDNAEDEHDRSAIGI